MSPTATTSEVSSHTKASTEAILRTAQLCWRTHTGTGSSYCTRVLPDQHLHLKTQIDVPHTQLHPPAKHSSLCPAPPSHAAAATGSGQGEAPPTLQHRPYTKPCAQHGLPCAGRPRRCRRPRGVRCPTARPAACCHPRGGMRCCGPWTACRPRRARPRCGAARLGLRRTSWWPR